MGYQTDIQKQEIEKIGLVVVAPRVRHTGWTLVSPQVYSTTFDLGVPVTCWEMWNHASPAEYNRVASVGAITPGQFHYDHETKVLTVGTFTLGGPDAQPLPGVTVQFEVHLSTRPIYGRRDPLSATFADIVEWEPALKEAPTANNGSLNDIFGFQPISISSIEVANGNGWMNELLYDVSWALAPLKAYLVVGSDYERAVQSSGVVQLFSGFVSGISEKGKVVSLDCADYTKKLDLAYAVTRTFNGGMGTIDPDAQVPGSEWLIPKLYGAVDGVEPVNIDYNATPSTSNNRKWATHDSEGKPVGDVSVVIDHLAANTTTKTFFTTTPPFNPGDRVTLNHASGVRRVRVVTVDRNAKFITHEIIARTFVIGETCTRSFIAAVWIIDRESTPWELVPGVHYNSFNDVGQQLVGFTLVNNFEATLGITHSPFDPSADKIYCRVYGTTELPTHSDSTDVGAISRASGVAADGVSLIARALQAAAIYNDQWDKTSFDDVGADSHTLGFMVPSERGGNPDTYRNIIGQLLVSQLWKLGLTITTTGAVKLGLAAVKPFPAPFDYAVDKTEFLEFTWEQDYADIYAFLKATYKKQKALFSVSIPLSSGLIEEESLRAQYVHLANARYEQEFAQFDDEEAATAAARMMFVLGERRGIYKLRVPYTQLLNAKVGANYQITRDHLPGFAYSFDAENARTLNLLEVQKDLISAALVLEDQKGVQDNSGDW